MAEEEERIYTIPLRTSAPRTKKASNTVKIIREYITRHMKPDRVWIDPGLNESVWIRGIQKPPARVRVRAVKFEDGLVEVSLPELEEKEKTEEKEKEEIKVKKGEKSEEKEEKRKKQKKTGMHEEKKGEKTVKTKTKENEKETARAEKNK